MMFNRQHTKHNLTLISNVLRSKCEQFSLRHESQQKTLSFDHESEMDRPQWHIKALGDIWKILAAL